MTVLGFRTKSFLVFKFIEVLLNTVCTSISLFWFISSSHHKITEDSFKNIL